MSFHIGFAYKADEDAEVHRTTAGEQCGCEFDTEKLFL